MISVRLELGPRWSVESLEALLRRTAEAADPGARLLAVARALEGTPFFYESMLPDPPPGCLRVRLETLDCATLVYTALAMAHARALPELVHHLARIRYVDGAAPIDSDPLDGNILGFSSECLMRQAIDLGYLRDVTDQLVENDQLAVMELEIGASRRPREHDPEERLERPRLGEGRRRARYLDRDSFARARWSAVRDGDIIAFSRGPRLKDGSANTDFVNHLGIAERVGGELSFIHATRHFAWRPGARADQPPRFSGLFYGPDRRREQIGTGPAGVYAGDDTAVEDDGQRLYGYDVERRRSVRDFAENIFAGIILLRPSDPPA